MRIATHWGVSELDCEGPWGCDALAPAGAAALYRGVSVAAPAARVFRWLCQLRAAPYSYDWIDNLGRTSPRELTPGLEELEIGQTVMTIFELVDFEPGSEITLRARRRRGRPGLFGDVWVSYRAVPADEAGTRLLAKLLFVPPPGLRGRLLSLLLPWGDLIMMRKQLLTLKHLSERNSPTP